MAGEDTGLHDVNLTLRRCKWRRRGIGGPRSQFAVDGCRQLRAPRVDSRAACRARSGLVCFRAYRGRANAGAHGDDLWILAPRATRDWGDPRVASLLICLARSIRSRTPASPFVAVSRIVCRTLQVRRFNCQPGLPICRTVSCGPQQRWIGSLRNGARVDG